MMPGSQWTKVPNLQFPRPSNADLGTFSVLGEPITTPHRNLSSRGSEKVLIRNSSTMLGSQWTKVPNLQFPRPSNADLGAFSVLGEPITMPHRNLPSSDSEKILGTVLRCLEVDERMRRIYRSQDLPKPISSHFLFWVNQSRCPIETYQAGVRKRY